MNNIWTSVGMFAAGVVTGGFVMWCYVKPKLEEAIEKHMEEPAAETEEETAPTEKKSEQLTIEDYTSILKKTGYNPDASEADVAKPYVITPDEFGDKDYDEVEYTLYADDVVADECGEAIEDADLEDWIGRENLKHMGEYEKDVLYIRNDRTRTDYVICKDLSTYASIVNQDPYAEGAE